MKNFIKFSNYRITLLLIIFKHYKILNQINFICKIKLILKKFNLILIIINNNIYYYLITKEMQIFYKRIRLLQLINTNNIMKIINLKMINFQLENKFEKVPKILLNCQIKIN